MKRVVAALTLIACSLLAPIAAGAREAAVARMAGKFTRALVAGEEQAARTFVLTRDELATITTKAPPKDEYDRVVDQWFASIRRELAEAKAKGKQIKAGEPVIEDVVLIPKSEKVKRQVVMVLVRPTLVVEGGEPVRNGPPVYFLDIDGDWKVSVKK